MRTKQGTIIGASMQKTVKIRVDTYKPHPKYKKRFLQSTNILAHVEMPCKIGDVVKIQETRPLSKRKRWIVIEKKKEN